MQLECPECGKYNNVSANFHIKCGSCSHRLDDKLFKNKSDSSGFGGVTVVAAMALSGGAVFLGSNLVNDNAEKIVTSRDYQMLEVCVQAADYGKSWQSSQINKSDSDSLDSYLVLERKYRKQVDVCVCAFNKTKLKFPDRTSEKVFLDAFKDLAKTCSQTT